MLAILIKFIIVCSEFEWWIFLEGVRILWKIRHICILFIQQCTNIVICYCSQQSLYVCVWNALIVNKYCIDCITALIVNKYCRQTTEQIKPSKIGDSCILMIKIFISPTHQSLNSTRKSVVQLCHCFSPNTLHQQCFNEIISMNFTRCTCIARVCNGKYTFSNKINSPLSRFVLLISNGTRKRNSGSKILIVCGCGCVCYWE